MNGEEPVVIFRLLGPIGVEVKQEERVPIPTPQIRALVVALLRQPGKYVPFDRLAEHIWANPPASARANMRTHIAALRKALATCTPGLSRKLETRRAGAGGVTAYRLNINPQQVDVSLFTDLADRGQRELATGRPRAAAQALSAALDLWHGPAGEDLPNTLPLRSWADALTEHRLTVIEGLAQTRLALGDHAGLVTGLRHHAAENPLRERAVGLLMQALHATGDRHAAIAAYQRHRADLADELGMEPSTHLQQLHLAMLRDDQISPLGSAA